MLSPHSSRNETRFHSETHELRLSLFQQVGHHEEKAFTHWLTDAELNSAHIHVLINCTKLNHIFSKPLIFIILNIHNLTYSL